MEHWPALCRQPGVEDSVHSRYVFSDVQNQYYEHFQNIQREFQVDLAEPLANVTRIAAESFTKALDERREKVISRIKKTNSRAATAITRIPPSAHYMFGGDHSRLAKVVELTKDLSSTANRSSFTTPKDKSKFRGGQGGGAGKGRGGPGGGGRDHGEHDEETDSGADGIKRRRSEAECSDSPSKHFSKFISYTNFVPVKLLSFDYIQVNPYPVPQGWSRTKDTFSVSSQPRTSLQSGAGRPEDGPSHRQDHNGSVYSG